MSLSEIRKIKDTLAKQSSQSSSTIATTSSALAVIRATSSPSELPPPSPASSVGSSAGSLAQLPSNDVSAATGPSPLLQHEALQKTITLYERYQRLMDLTLRSQSFWDMNDSLVNDNDSLNGERLFNY